MNKIRMILIVFLSFLFLFVVFFFVGFPSEEKNLGWGVNFSQKHATNLGMDWKEAYSALLNELGVRKIKIASYWDLLEPERNVYSFDSLDWKINKAKEKGAKVLLAVGIKTPRWPECHLPEWAQELEEEEQKERILKLVKEIILRYRQEETIWAWQAENEPFFAFGECPWKIDRDFLEKEIALIKENDPLKRPVLVTGTGEFSFWLKPALSGDIVGATLYRKVWMKELNTYFTHFFPPVFYSRRAKIINYFFNKEVICVELQAEPWTPNLIYNSTLEEQKKTMDLEQFRKNVNFAKRTGLKEFYFWGAEWWYWMKKENNRPEIWEEAKKLF
jgi:hypothetical protein